MSRRRASRSQAIVIKAEMVSPTFVSVKPCLLLARTSRIKEETPSRLLIPLAHDIVDEPGLYTAAVILSASV